MGENLLESYNPLYDVHLRQYFALPHMQKHLRNLGLLDGSPVQQQNELHAGHVAMMDLMLRNRERVLQQLMDLQRKLDAAEKVELYRRIRSGITNADEADRQQQQLQHMSRSLSRPARSAAARLGERRGRRQSLSPEANELIKRVESDYRSDSAPFKNPKSIYNRLAASVYKYQYLHKLDDRTLRKYMLSLRKQLAKLERFREVSFGQHTMAKHAPPQLQQSWFFRRRSLPSLNSANANQLRTHNQQNNAGGHQRSLKSGLAHKARSGKSQSPLKFASAIDEPPSKMQRRTSNSRTRQRLPPLPKKRSFAASRTNTLPPTSKASERLPQTAAIKMIRKTPSDDLRRAPPPSAAPKKTPTGSRPGSKGSTAPVPIQKRPSGTDAILPTIGAALTAATAGVVLSSLEDSEKKTEEEGRESVAPSPSISLAASQTTTTDGGQPGVDSESEEQQRKSSEKTAPEGTNRGTETRPTPELFLENEIGTEKKQNNGPNEDNMETEEEEEAEELQQKTPMEEKMEEQRVEEIQRENAPSPEERHGQQISPMEENIIPTMEQQHIPQNHPEEHEEAKIRSLDHQEEYGQEAEIRSLDHPEEHEEGAEIRSLDHPEEHEEGAEIRSLDHPEEHGEEAETRSFGQEAEIRSMDHQEEHGEEAETRSLDHPEEYGQEAETRSLDHPEEYGQEAETRSLDHPEENGTEISLDQSEDNPEEAEIRSLKHSEERSEETEMRSLDHPEEESLDHLGEHGEEAEIISLIHPEKHGEETATRSLAHPEERSMGQPEEHGEEGEIRSLKHTEENEEQFGNRPMSHDEEYGEKAASRSMDYPDEHGEDAEKRSLDHPEEHGEESEIRSLKNLEENGKEEAEIISLDHPEEHVQEEAEIRSLKHLEENGEEDEIITLAHPEEHGQEEADTITLAHPEEHSSVNDQQAFLIENGSVFDPTREQADKFISGGADYNDVGNDSQRLKEEECPPEGCRLQRDNLVETEEVLRSDDDFGRKLSKTEFYENRNPDEDEVISPHKHVVAEDDRERVEEGGTERSPSEERHSPKFVDGTANEAMQSWQKREEGEEEEEGILNYFGKPTWKNSQEGEATNEEWSRVEVGRDEAAEVKQRRPSEEQSAKGTEDGRGTQLDDPPAQLELTDGEGLDMRRHSTHHSPSENGISPADNGTRPATAEAISQDFDGPKKMKLLNQPSIQITSASEFDGYAEGNLDSLPIHSLTKGPQEEEAEIHHSPNEPEQEVTQLFGDEDEENPKPTQEQVAEGHNQNGEDKGEERINGGGEEGGWRMGEGEHASLLLKEVFQSVAAGGKSNGHLPAAAAAEDGGGGGASSDDTEGADEDGSDGDDGSVIIRHQQKSDEEQQQQQSRPIKAQTDDERQ